MYEPTRRDTLTALAASAAAAALSNPALAQGTDPATALVGPALADGQSFSASAVVDLARALSKKPFVAPPSDLPAPVANLNYEQYVGIKGLPSASIWEDGRGFVAEPLLRGFVFATPVYLFAVDDGRIRRIAYDRTRFDFGKLDVAPNAPEIGFSGFRVSAVPSDRPSFEFAIVQGGTFFRALARGQNFGTVSRALTLKPADPKGEEFPIFRAFWLQRAAPGSNTLVVHGLIDSESAAGAVRLTFRPGDTTIVDVEETLFPRVALDHVGWGGMAATFLYGPGSRRAGDEVRPAVFDVGGLQVENGQGEWLWRPLNNPDTLQISAFLDDKPRGFGLLQRERDPDFFQDDGQKPELRPSLWIEPIGEWGSGAVQLIEIPSDSEVNDNILAYWRPKEPLAAGSENTFAYRQFWCWSPPSKPPLATVATTRQGRGASGKRRRFVVEFTGDGLAQPIEGLDAQLSVGPGQITGKRVWTYPERKVVRVAFQLEPGSETACELRLLLQAGDKPLSETWLYRWTP